MNTDHEPSTTLAPLSPIRVETALSRYPVHRLAKHGDIAIDIQEKNENGEVNIKWEVNHISKFKQPGPLAYKLDTLVINRRIEEAPRPIPRMIRLGSLKEIAGQLDLGGDTSLVKNALRQNASLFIIASINYKLADGTEKRLEADFNRYSVIFTGEKLPNGNKADAVYLILSDVFMQVIDSATTRPLDYDYLKILPPAAQRLYELLSYQMYATIKNDRPRAKFLYSELCKYAPLVRQFHWDQVRPQITRIHAPHKQSGYIAKVEFQPTTDSHDQPDWIIFYTPGPKARAEYLTFTKRGNTSSVQAGPVSPELETIPSVQRQLDLEFAPARKRQSKVTQPPSPLVAELEKHGVTQERAAELVQRYPERIEPQIEYLKWEMAKKPGKIQDPAAYLVKAIERNNAAPKKFISAAERERQAEAKRQAEQHAAEDRRRKQAEEARERQLAAQVKTYRQSLTPEQLSQLEADAIGAASDETRSNLNDPAMKPFRKTLVSSLVNEHIGRMLQAEAKQAEPA